MGEWFKNLDLLRPVYELYAGVVTNYRLSSETKFLTLVQALEALH